MRPYASRPEAFHTPTPPSQFLLAGRFMPDGNTIEIRLARTQLNCKGWTEPRINTAYANTPLIDESS